METTAGTVRGRREGGVDIFRGVPYAAPPVGHRRFRAPEPAVPWAGVRDCVEPGPIALQGPVAPPDLLMGRHGRRQDEDCLRLDVWTPGCDDARRPVLVWVHGGAFTMGSSSAPWTDAARLAARDAVVVSCNYRLGVFGFLHLAGHVGDAYPESGNVGLLDQVAALSWVRDNIAAFGGDPERVTVFGQSAGAASIAFLLAMPAARGQFRRAVVQSGAFPVHEPEDAERTTRLLLDVLGLDASEAPKLAEIPAEALLGAQVEMMERYWASHLGPPAPAFTRLPLQPVADGVTLPRPVLDGIAAGPTDVELLLGSNADEVNLMGMLPTPREVSPADLAERARAIFGEETGRRVMDVYRAGRPRAGARELLFALETDQYFRIQGIRIAEHHPGPVHVYWLTLAGTGMGTVIGAAHGLETPFVFDNLDARGVEQLLGPVTDEGRDLAALMSDVWVGFARSGELRHPQLPDWPRYAAGSRQVMELCAAPQVLDDPQGAERVLWEEVQ